MGSGKGQMNRVRATATGSVSAPASMSWRHWREFVQQNRLQRVTVGGYYETRADDHQSGAVIAAEIEGTVRELFHDWVGTGTLTLPAGRSVDDYAFYLQGGISDNWDAMNMVWCRDIKSGAAGMLFRCTPDSLDDRIGTVMWKYVLQSLVLIMNGDGKVTAAVVDDAGNFLGFAS